MSIKVKVKGSKEEFDLARGSQLPREGDIIHLTLRGKKNEKTYTVYMVEHTVNLNDALPIGQIVVTLEEVKE